MRWLGRILLVIVAIVILVLGMGAGYVTYTTRRPLPQTSGTLSLAGLNSKVTIYRDAEGVPQIYATTAHDLFMAQGYIHAQDRWWQMEFNRRIGEGRISELVGKNDAALSNDTFIRTVGWNRMAQAMLKNASPDTMAVLNAYSDGVNAYLYGKSSADLAVQYSLLALNGVSITVDNWQPVDTIAFGIAQSWSLSGNMDEELQRVSIYKALGDKFGAPAEDIVNQFLIPPYPYDKKPTVLSAAELGGKISAADNLALATSYDWSNVETNLIGNVPLNYAPIFGKGAGIGSNDWVVSGKLTKSGKPLLANDPHLGIQIPAIWYENGLHCVTVSAACPYDVYGYSFPATPGVVIGHNQHIGWGVTNVGPDTQDLYTIKVDPASDTKYQVDGQSQDMTVITEVIKFGDKTPSQNLRVRVTRFGPIITDAGVGKDAGVPLALHWAVSDINPANDLLGAVIGIDKATDWASFRDALKMWGSPSQNFVFADVAGNIGYQMPGLIPVRAKNDLGLVPMDGSTTQNDWKGYIPFDDLPMTYNPDRGYIVTANNAVVPLSYAGWLASQLGAQDGADSNYQISRSWDFDYGYRSGRITDLITASSQHTVDSFKQIQADVIDNGAKDILPVALKVDYSSTSVPKAVIDWLGQWDYQTRIENGQAALYAAFYQQLVTMVWKTRLGSAPDGPNIVLGMRLLMDQPDSVLWNDATTGKKQSRDDVIRAAMTTAYQNLSKQLGADTSKWQWGTIHQALFVNQPLGASGIDFLEQYVNIGPVPVNGSNETVTVSHWANDDPTFTTGGGISSMRMILDFSDFNGSQWIIPTGQSGHPAAAHYRDQNQKWLTNQYDTIGWGDAPVQAAAVDTLILKPQ
jgi:penicillin amidase